MIVQTLVSLVASCNQVQKPAAAFERVITFRQKVQLSEITKELVGRVGSEMTLNSNLTWELEAMYNKKVDHGQQELIEK